MNKTSRKLTNITCFFLLLFFELLNRDEYAFLSLLASGILDDTHAVSACSWFAIAV